MKTLDLNFAATRVNIEQYGGSRSIYLEVEKADVEDILDQIGKEEALAYFGIEEAQ